MGSQLVLYREAALAVAPAQSPKTPSQMLASQMLDDWESMTSARATQKRKAEKEAKAAEKAQKKDEGKHVDRASKEVPSKDEMAGAAETPNKPRAPRAATASAEPSSGQKVGRKIGVSLEATRSHWLARNGGVGKGTTKAFKFTSDEEKALAYEKASAWVAANAV